MLTDRGIANAKRTGKAYQLVDGKGLYLEVSAAGSKIWRYRYRFGGKENRLSIGKYPDVSLVKAREERDRLREMLKAGQDPLAHRHAEQEQAEQAARDTFKAVTLEYLERNSSRWAESTKRSIISRFEIALFPWLKHRPIAEITPPELLRVLRHTEARGKVFSATKAKALAGQVFRYGVATGRCDRDPSADLRGALAPVKTTHRAAITDPKELAPLMRDIDRYRGSFIVGCALRLLPLTMLRAKELRTLEWKEVRLDEGLLRISAERMKMGREHLVPLSRQVLEIFNDLHPVTSDGVHVFPGLTGGCMSHNALWSALRRMGYDNATHSVHGFRTTASTLLHELGYPSEIIEKQLAHEDRNTVRATYNRAEYLEERRRMLQAWADYLDALKTGAKVTPLRAVG